MGNKGAFIKFKGKDMKPEFKTFSAVVNIYLCIIIVIEKNLIIYI